MCGIAGIVSSSSRVDEHAVKRMIRALQHRGPDDEGTWIDGKVGLGNRRLAVLDLSPAGHQPMATRDGRFVLTYNGEIYNYLELKRELNMSCNSGSDTEVLAQVFERFGIAGLDRLNGMFAFGVWDRFEHTLFLVRDRFGVKPLYFAEFNGMLYFASEIKALAAAGLPIEPDVQTWSLYLGQGIYDNDEFTFFKGIRSLPPGHFLKWHDGLLEIHSWYDLPDRLVESFPDARCDEAVQEEYQELLINSVRLRFRSDVPVAVCLSGGLDSSILVGVLNQLFGSDADINAYHFTCGNAAYDETKWVRNLLKRMHYPLHVVQLLASEIPSLAEEAIYYQEAPFGGVPTLGMVKLFKQARSDGSVVLLDGQGLDEQWAGYDYYRHISREKAPLEGMPVQGSSSPSVLAKCLTNEFLQTSRATNIGLNFDGSLQACRYRDLRYTKLPRALRFNDRASSQASCELREPCLDYRLVELAFRQPDSRLIRGGVQKYLLRQIGEALVPSDIARAPKRAVQTPQREWLRGPLRDWVEECLSDPAVRCGWFEESAIQAAWDQFVKGQSDNSFYVWQWISVALNRRLITRLRDTEATAPALY